MIGYKEYADSKPIEPKLVTAWILRYATGREIVYIAEADATVETMLEAIKTDKFTNPARIGSFTLERVDLGRFEIRTNNAKLYTRYSGDGRHVTNDAKIKE